MTPARLYIRAITTSAALAVILFGVPLLLSAAVGNPLPDLDALRVGDLSMDVLIDLSASATWAGWAYFVLLIVVETRAQIRHRPSPVMPGLPNGPNLIQTLVAAALLTTPGVAVPAVALAAPHPAPPDLGTRAAATSAPITLVHAKAPISHGADQAPSPHEHETTDRRDDFVVGMGAGIGLSLIAATLSSIIRRRRHHQAIARRPGHLPALVPPGIAQTEQRLRDGSRVAEALREHLHRTLADLHHALSAQNEPPVSILAVRVDYASLDMIITEPDRKPPQPWHQDTQTGTWTLHTPLWATTDTSNDTNLAAEDEDAAPHSTHRTTEQWTWIGTSTTHTPGRRPSPEHDDVWLLNLNAIHALRVIGPADTATHLVRAMILSQDPTGTRTEIHSATQELTELSALTHRATAAAATNDPATPATLRILDQIHPATSPAPPAAPAHPTQLILTSDLASARPDEVRLVVDATGLLHTSITGTPLTAAGLSDQALHPIRPALEEANAPATRTPPPHTPETSTSPQNPTIDVLGTPIPTPPDPPASAPSAQVSLLHTHTRTQITAATGITGHDQDTIAPPLTPTQQQALDTDPGLDHDLHLWHSQNCPRPRLSLLGPIHVRANGNLPPRGHRIPWWTEIVVLLSAHPEGLSYDQLAELLWPDDALNKAAGNQPRQAISAVRRWLGTDPDTGAHYLPEGRPGTSQRTTHRIDGLLTDADLARRLRTRAIARGPAAIPDLETALTLVTGRILDGRRRNGYDWLTLTPLHSDLTALITDTAHTLAAHWLTAHQPDRAEKASRIAILAGSNDDITHLDLIAAATAREHHTEADWWLQRLITAHDGDIEEDLPPATLARLQHLRRSARRRAQRPD
ncbi:hypothetical protein KIH74_35035 [Kineosporia sp. J2-2]|uniref:Bacterial transcriptional activator domain-containing protein n=1 Tax=Kineosporia corallincola TaxID=2835133 RepID=A0ABS5TTS4_9ACTN|nr:hypothetical protein [Kineosporia corallincola]MBT0774213.1 hypothetical protein [Kineosporia corallincola]